MKQSIIVSILALALGGCGSSVLRTASFAPPAISASTHPNNQTLPGAIALTNQYIETYRVAGSQLSNGRQWFDLPSVAVGVGGATAAALGASPDVAIGTGAFTALSNSAKGYYKPNDRADVYYDAVEALTCIQQVSLGVSAFERVPKSSPEAAEVFKFEQTLYDNYVPSIREQQYFFSVRNGVLKVENIARTRLAATGSVDVSALIAEIDKLKQAAEQAKAEANKAKDQQEKFDEGKIRLLRTPPMHKNYDAYLENLDFKVLVAEIDECTGRAWTN